MSNENRENPCELPSVNNASVPECAGLAAKASKIRIGKYQKCSVCQQLEVDEIVQQINATSNEIAYFISQVPHKPSFVQAIQSYLLQKIRLSVTCEHTDSIVHCITLKVVRNAVHKYLSNLNPESTILAGQVSKIIGEGDELMLEVHRYSLKHKNRSNAK